MKLKIPAQVMPLPVARFPELFSGHGGLGRLDTAPPPPPPDWEQQRCAAPGARFIAFYSFVIAFDNLFIAFYNFLYSFV